MAVAALFLLSLLAGFPSVLVHSQLSLSVIDPLDGSELEIHTEWFFGADSAAGNWRFERRTSNADGGSAYSWTTTRACPAVVPVLDRASRIEMPALTNSADETFVGIRMRIYRLSSPVYYPGGHLGRATLVTDTETELAGWIEEMIVSLQDCWSAQRPGDGHRP